MSYIRTFTQSPRWTNVVRWSILSLLPFTLASPFALMAPAHRARADDGAKQEGAKSDDDGKEDEGKKDVKKDDAKKDEGKKAPSRVLDAEDGLMGRGVGKSRSRPPLEIELLPIKGSYADLPQPMELDVASLLSGPTRQKSFYRLCEYLDRLASDEDAGEWVVLDLSSSSFGLNLPQSAEFIRRFQKVREKKRTIAWLEDANSGQLALAAQCEHVVLADFGSIDLPSVSMETMYYKDAMDLLGVHASVVRAGDFKGAVEPYTNPKMSDHLKEHYVRMLKSINDARVQQIAQGRGLTVEAVRQLQSQRFISPKQALRMGLVDRVAPHGSMKETIAAMTKRDEVQWNSPKKKPKRKMSFFELMGEIMAGPKKRSTKAEEDCIAVLHLSGAIVRGTSRSSAAMVSGPSVKAIQELMDDDHVKAVVIRVNSPGGSATASEEIRQQLAKLKEMKPCVVSMGDMAASGGYWISCIGAPIYAEEGTVTGSIGVFSMKLSLGAMLRRAGVHVESIVLDESAAAFSIARPFTEAEQKAFAANVDDIYQRFLKLVAKSRRMKVREVKAIAGGRVWSGAQAKSLGLIDELGGVDACISRLRTEAKLADDCDVIHRPLNESNLGLLGLLGDEDEDEIRSLLPSAGLRLLERQGFDMQTTMMLLRESLGKPHKAPVVWLLNPAEIQVR